MKKLVLSVLMCGALMGCMAGCFLRATEAEPLTAEEAETVAASNLPLSLKEKVIGNTVIIVKEQEDKMRIEQNTDSLLGIGSAAAEIAGTLGLAGATAIAIALRRLRKKKAKKL